MAGGVDTGAVAAGGAGRDLRVAGLVALAHGTSHFYQLVLPPLFPLLVADLGVSYTALGALMTTFFVVSGMGQPVSGFLVDRFGARRMMLLGLGACAAAAGTMAAAPGFAALFPAVALAALGNCVFHPVDFALLNANVRASHLGRAYGAHTLGGNLGWAVAPAFVLPIAAAAGWRAALAAAALLGAGVWLALWWHRGWLRDERDRGRVAEPVTAAAVRMLFEHRLLMCFAYFVLVAAALIAVQDFLPPVLNGLRGTPLALGASALTAFLLGASAGVVVGGFAADRGAGRVAVIALGLGLASALLLAVAHLDLPPALLLGALAGAGFLAGMTNPSRDLLVRAATPAGASGRVFGFVYSGLDVGAASAPIAVGALIDAGHPRLALWAVAACFAAAILTAVGVRGASRRAPPPGAACRARSPR